jgi:hypothetical protein
MCNPLSLDLAPAPRNAPVPQRDDSVGEFAVVVVGVVARKPKVCNLQRAGPAKALQQSSACECANNNMWNNGVVARKATVRTLQRAGPAKIVHKVQHKVQHIRG